MPHRGTPYLCVNDQLHNIVHSQIRLELRSMCGLDLALQDRPRGESLKKFKTPGGTRRGPEEIMLAEALYRVCSHLDRVKVAAG